tara:strand:+ start:5041 stop:5454 length:414 start_codon:yes stop_codon:yes gene_type:complete
MTVEQISKYEKAVVSLLNLDGWDLEWCGGGFEHFDAKGKTSKGFECRIEMKFRNKYYPEKLLEKYKYDKLMEIDPEIVKLYFVADDKGNYLFWLNDIEMPKIEKRYCPSSSLWNGKKELKEVYLLSENLAARINWNT